MNTTTTSELRKNVRIAFGLKPHSRVDVVVDERATRVTYVERRAQYHTTPSGKTVVRHPTAYGWPTKYCPAIPAKFVLPAQVATAIEKWPIRQLSPKLVAIAPSDDGQFFIAYGMADFRVHSIPWGWKLVYSGLNWKMVQSHRLVESPLRSEFVTGDAKIDVTAWVVAAQ
jgi:hypothetical protein